MASDNLHSLSVFTSYMEIFIPQMAPANWLILFSLSHISLAVTFSAIHFS